MSPRDQSYEDHRNQQMTGAKDYAQGGFAELRFLRSNQNSDRKLSACTEGPALSRELTNVMHKAQSRVWHGSRNRMQRSMLERKCAVSPEGDLIALNLPDKDGQQCELVLTFDEASCCL
jgi:hypothetical protein